MTLRGFSFFLALFAAGCSGSTVTTAGDAGDAGDAATNDASVADGSAADAGPTDTGAPDASDAAVACNALVNASAVVAITQVASAPPAAQGGTIVDGTYFMTAAAIYTGVGGPSGGSGTGQVTIQIAGNTVQVANKATPPMDHITTTITTNGTSFTRTDSCPDTASQQGAYTATSTTFIAILPAGMNPDGGARTLVETFTKQ